MSIFKLPDLGEGLSDAEIVSWHVKIDDIIEHDQPLVTMETAKAIVEVPSPFTGKIVKLFGLPKDVIKTGDPLVEYSLPDEAGLSPTRSEAAIKEQMAEQASSEKANDSDSGTVAGRLEIGNIVMQESSSALSSDVRSPWNSVKATPAVRALAKRLNVDLTTVTPSGPDNTLTSRDVENAAKLLHDAPPLEPLRGTRRIMNDIMTKSHQEVVGATIVDDAILNWEGKEDITVRVIQGIIKAMQLEPGLNAWFDSQMPGIRVFKELHLGLAIDTQDGLFVPVIKNAGNLDQKALREKIDSLKKEVLERTVQPEMLRGATFTLSNFGKFAGLYANPIVVPPAVAILAIGKLRSTIVPIDSKPAIRQLLPLSLTFDHRVVTGGEAARFLSEIIHSLV